MPIRTGLSRVIQRGTDPDYTFLLQNVCIRKSEIEFEFQSPGNCPDTPSVILLLCYLGFCCCFTLPVRPSDGDLDPFCVF